MAKVRNKINIDYLYNLNEADFVQEAFRVLLKREVDQEGLAYYINRLNVGKSKTSVLIQIMSSQEYSNDCDIVDSNKLLKVSKFLSKPLFNKPIKNYAKPLRVMDKRLDVAVKVFEGIYFGNSNTKKNIIVNKTPKISVSESLSNENYSYMLDMNKKIMELESNILQQERIINSLPILTNNQENKVYLNITTLKRWNSSMVGIVRAEFELAKHIYNNDVNSTFIVWLESKQNFFECPLSIVKKIFKDDYRQVNIEINDEDFTQILSIKKDDILISIGLDWDNRLTQKFYELKKDTECKVVLACYDLVPILYPEYTVDPNFKQIFKHHFADMFYTADLVWTISENSKKDLENFWRTDCGFNLNFAPPVVKVYLGSDFDADLTNEVLTESETNQLRHILCLGRFVMYVSSFEPRKNHKLLLDIWRRGYKKYGENWPTLVIVGRHGWGSDDLINQMNRMLAKQNDKIIWLNSASDLLLAKLYEQVDFTLFPSLYEGWGLAATESLAYGKPCIVANNSSLIEATQKIMPSLHPLDYPNWQAEIEKMIFNPTYAEKLRKNIDKSYKNQSWKDFSETFVKEVKKYCSSTK